jgi:hypothetical protein
MVYHFVWVWSSYLLRHQVWWAFCAKDYGFDLSRCINSVNILPLNTKAQHWQSNFWMWQVPPQLWFWATLTSYNLRATIFICYTVVIQEDWIPMLGYPTLLRIGNINERCHGHVPPVLVNTYFSEFAKLCGTKSKHHTAGVSTGSYFIWTKIRS